MNYKMGEVHEGTATMDFLEEEQERRGITIQSAATTCPCDYRGETYTVNLIDTPGHVDFTIEVERSMRVLDGAVTVFDGKEGVEAQSETVWRQADRYNVPRICFINKMDKIGADFEFSYNSIIERLGANPIAVQIPIGAGDELEGLIDLIEMRAFYFDSGELGAVVEERDVPDALMEEAKQWRHRMLEQTAELDDAFMEQYLEDEDSITDDMICATPAKGPSPGNAPPPSARAAPETSASSVCSTGSSTSSPIPRKCPTSRVRTHAMKTKHSHDPATRMPRSPAWSSRSSRTRTVT